MRFTRTDIDGVVVIDLEPFADERGAFARIWCEEELRAEGLTAHLSQCSISQNPRAGTLRGMHYQRAPHEEAKLVRCTRGAIYDVALDLREGSATWGRWHGVELSAGNGRGLFVPEGCAHGFQTLVPDTDVLYLISHPYTPAASAGVRWDDPAFGIEWPPAQERTVGPRDLDWPDYAADGRAGSLRSRGA